ncbi:unnamed protein product [Phytophthora lilii]|uniref:RxLR effector protein n=1 Tax=Phytophthora lilii TaxID=2077276 RepID=A0A9W6U4A8_9STRA|nr:unnamed protein product [Phytophthora lilii]
MRLCYLAFVATAALLAGRNDVSAAANVNQNTLSRLDSADVEPSVHAVVVEDSVGDFKRNLRVDKTAETDTDGEERGFISSFLDWRHRRKQYRMWYGAELKPGEVVKMMKRRESLGREVDWDVVNGYPEYYRQRQSSFFF